MKHKQPPRAAKSCSLKTPEPVKELESHVNPEWRRYIFNALYLKTGGDVVEDEEITIHETDRFLEILNIKKNAAMLDVCWGQARHCFEFFKRGYKNAEGIDRSSFLIAKARNKNKLNNSSIKFKEGNARKLPYSDESFDVITILGNSFGYFESSEDDLTVVQSIFRVLKPGGKILIDVANGSFPKKNFNPRSWEWINDTHFVCRERGLSASGRNLYQEK